MTPEEKAFKEVFDAADFIRHWHDSGKDGEGIIVSAKAVRRLNETLEEHRDYRKSLIVKE